MQSQHIHILGIAGTFMAGLAVIAKQMGYIVTGTDAKIYPPMSDLLSKNNINPIEGYDNPDNLKAMDKAEVVIIGNALSRGNACVEYLLEHKKKFISGPQWLYENILRNKWVLAVSGTHGKTTTSSMLAWVLEYNKHFPSFLIGGMASNFNASARLSDSKYFVIEADEYDTAFYDKRPKFLHYFPNTLILNNIEFDHADIYSDIKAIEAQFGYLLRTVPKKDGCVIAPLDVKDKFINPNETVYKTGVGSKLDLNFKFFSSNYSESSAKDKNMNLITAQLHKSDGSSFDCYYNGNLQGTVDYSLVGEHNVNNSLAVILAANSIGIPMADAIEALNNFKGVARRLEKKAELPNNILVFDDFAHHPTAIKTTLSGLKQKYHNRRLTAVIDFSSYSMKNKVHSDEDFVAALESADVVYLYQDSAMGWDCAVLLDKIKKHHSQKIAFLYKTSESLVDDLAENSEPNDVIVFMTKSAFNKNIDLLVKNLERAVS